ncbi:site-2 protease family protein [Microcoleus sp. FACHB-831]|uniref:site-2 protease family protein n=1 Tax=Microcoleus sp. FACHB-831 TaxID=2692827 RepID=UPI001687BABD|nr:site-2 protease family protein [Microcoleus sp. FACHB-831]MBD1920434.1 site-2 protease family protein [Microcoleus sp. FACHB-831]
MFNASETAATGLIVLIALGILGWGFYRAKPFGKLGILAWLQSVVLMTPWLLFFGLFAAGIYINLVGILFLIVASAGLYIFLGKRLRTAAKDAEVMNSLRTRVAQIMEESDSTEKITASDASPASSVPTPEVVKAIEVVPIPDEDLKTIKNIFGIDTFFATETIPYQEGVIFKGNLRGEPDAVHSRLSASLQERLGDRYRLFLVENPEAKPVVIILPSSNDPQTTTLPQKILALSLLVATIASSLETGGLFLGFDFFNNPSRYREVLPITAGIWAVLASHELGHRWMARRYNVRLSLPFFIPSWEIGSFGAITRFESLLPNRTVLFDISLAGPATSGIISLLMLLTGLLLSHDGSLFKVPSQFFQGSILVGTLSKVVLGSALQKTLVDVHPLTIIGWLGLVLTALNLMPAGLLDGGRMVQAIYGRKIARATTVATLVVLGIICLVNPGNPVLFYWAIVILFLQRGSERPSLNEITEPDDARAALALLALFLMVATLIPLAPGLAGRLGIGG